MASGLINVTGKTPEEIRAIREAESAKLVAMEIDILAQQKANQIVARQQASVFGVNPESPAVKIFVGLAVASLIIVAISGKGGK